MPASRWRPPRQRPVVVGRVDSCARDTGRGSVGRVAGQLVRHRPEELSMSVTMSESEQVGRRLSPAAGWTPTARYGAAVALSLGGLLWMVGELVHLDASGVDFMRWVAEHPT